VGIIRILVVPLASLVDPLAYLVVPSFAFLVDPLAYLAVPCMAAGLVGIGQEVEPVDFHN